MLHVKLLFVIPSSLKSQNGTPHIRSASHWFVSALCATGVFLTETCTVPVGIAAAVVQASLYDVPGGYRAVMFDRFSGVKDEVTLALLFVCLGLILFPCRQKPKELIS